MEKYEHLRLPPITENIERQTRAGGGGYTSPSGRNKADFARQAVQKADEIKSSLIMAKKLITRAAIALKIGIDRDLLDSRIRFGWHDFPKYIEKSGKIHLYDEIEVDEYIEKKNEATAKVNKKKVGRPEKLGDNQKIPLSPEQKLFLSFLIGTLHSKQQGA